MSGLCNLGLNPGRLGTITLDGTYLSSLQSQLDVVGLMNVGVAGKGVLNVSGGAFLTASELRIGIFDPNGSLGQGEVTVQGFNETIGSSKVEVTNLSIGTVAGGGGGLLTIRNGGFV
ncbi:MAG: hypothetical protein M3O82_06270, partial [Verrucomicrobiota bacterium]|nr:hypothetical protein [Verrucomicrobiota bacterium]